MDIYCPRCGEPTDHDELHAHAEAMDRTYEKVAADWRVFGCGALGVSCNTPSERVDPVFGLTPQAAADALYDIMGEDMDGAAAMMEDMGF